MSVAKSYAKALYEAGRDAKLSASELDAIESQLQGLADAVTASRTAQAALYSPAISPKEKADLVASIASKMGMKGLLANFMVLLARKERLSLLPELPGSFAEARLDAEGGILGTVVSADPLDPADLDGLSRSFSEKLGRKVAFQTATDPQLLAGIKVTVNGVTYDGTLRSQLHRLRDSLVYGTSQSH